MSRASLRFSSDILKRLGEELNPNPDQGIIELAKNAYDADAHSCIVELHDVGAPGGQIRVADDGDGMTLQQIREGFLVLGRSQKDVGQETRLGRIPAGNKGLGRLAALRLGRGVRLDTQSRKKGEQRHELAIDWDRFEKEDLVEDVLLEIQSKPRRKEQNHGTTLALLDLHNKLSRPDVKRIARALILLADPFDEDPGGFRPQLKATEFEDLERLVSARYFEDADYHLVAAVDEDGEASAEVLDWRGEELFSASHKDLTRRRKGAPFRIPPTVFDLWTYRLQQAAFAGRTTTVGEVKEWLRAFGGVHLYVNGLRVAPYGNPGNDWLEMNLGRSASPEERPSTNNSLGRMSVEDYSGLLTQKTDRSGLIESEAYEDLQSFGREAIAWMQRRRLEVAERRRRANRATAKAESARGKEDLVQAIEETKNPKRRESLQKAFRQYDKARQKEADRLRQEVQLYRTMSTAGITAATFAHESASNPLKVIAQSAITIERRGRKALNSDYENSLGKAVTRLKRASKALGVLSSVTLTLIERDRRRPGRVELHKVFKAQLRTLKPFLEGRDVEVIRNFAPGNPYLRGTPAAIESIFTNLINNALTALEASEADQRVIEVRTELEEDILTLRVLDNGPGIDISQLSLREIWLPGETTHDTGLGLTIVRDAVADLGGAVDAVAKGDLGGAEFIIELPILGV